MPNHADWETIQIQSEEISNRDQEIDRLRRRIAELEGNQKTYKIVRFHKDKPSQVHMRGLTLEEAQAHCRDEKTHGPDWFDGYTEE